MKWGFALDWMLSETRSNSIIGHLNKSYLKREYQTKDKDVIKGTVVTHIRQNRGSLVISMDQIMFMFCLCSDLITQRLFQSNTLPAELFQPTQWSFFVLIHYDQRVTLSNVIFCETLVPGQVLAVRHGLLISFLVLPLWPKVDEVRLQYINQ